MSVTSVCLSLLESVVVVFEFRVGSCALTLDCLWSVSVLERSFDSTSEKS